MNARATGGRLVPTWMATILAVGCATVIQAGANYEPGTTFGGFNTFHWDEPDDNPTGDPRLENNPFFLQRLHHAIEWELGTRGVRLVEGGGALTVHHHATVRDRVQVFAADERAGYSTPEYGEGTQILQFEEGTFLVDIADAESQEILWRGWAQLDIGTALEDPETMREQIDEAIRLMFEQFPGDSR